MENHEFSFLNIKGQFIDGKPVRDFAQFQVNQSLNKADVVVTAMSKWTQRTRYCGIIGI